MAVSAIQNNNNPNKGYKSKSYLGSIALGATAGYSLKWLLPLTPQEKDEEYSLKLDKLKSESKLSAIKAASSSNEPGSDIFTSYIKSKMPYSVFSKDKAEKNIIFKFIKTVNKKARLLVAEGFKAIVLRIKDLRPASVFIATGAAIGLSFAFVSNVINKMSSNNSEES